ncbi:MAG: hypothetical protein HGN29_17285 [Asgard group archaeon]|nr:hypothetical protein [Asgard group archaeon]
MSLEEEVVPEEERIEELLKALDDESAQEGVVQALGKIGQPVLPYLEKRIKSKYEVDRLASELFRAKP